jgi:hypothetical protein
LNQDTFKSQKEDVLYDTTNIGKCLSKDCFSKNCLQDFNIKTVLQVRKELHSKNNEKEKNFMLKQRIK